jgi:hypothetical protein
MTNVDNIGYFRGKAIGAMSREELLEFAGWAGPRIVELEKMADKHLDLDLNREALSLTPQP